jgi:hypothetical protein
MTDSGNCSEFSSYILVKSKGGNDEAICKSCRDYEIQLKEALDELSLAQTIISLLGSSLHLQPLRVHVEMT